MIAEKAADVRPFPKKTKPLKTRIASYFPVSSGTIAVELETGGPIRSLRNTLISKAQEKDPVGIVEAWWVIGQAPGTTGFYFEYTDNTIVASNSVEIPKASFLTGRIVVIT